MRRVHLCALLLALVLPASLTPAAAQQPPQPASAELAAAIPVDPEVRVGTLPNGMRFFVRRNGWPANRAELRLAVNAGSVLEADDQKGIAHFLEHMAFNGTKHFPKQELVQYLQSIGMRFGPDVNAYTGFDETVYMLQLPTDNPVFMQKGIRMLGDWAHAQTFDHDEIDAERGVVIEEWRLRRGAGARMQDKQLPVLLRGSRYAERLPIGDPELLRTFEYDAVKRFYRDWYRPDLMAVIAIGDFDPAQVEQMIRETFGEIPAPIQPTKVPVYAVPEHDEAYAVVATDREATNSSIQVYHLVPPRNHLTFGGYRDRTIEQLYFAMLNARVAEIARKPDAPFVGGSIGRGYFLRTADAYTISAGAKEGRIPETLDLMLTELERAARHGFTQGELDRARANAMASAERLFAQREQRTSASRADELVRHVLNGEDAAGTEAEHEMKMRILPAVTLAQINELARTRPPAANRVIMASSPQKDGLPVPTEAQLLAVANAVKTRNIEPYQDVIVNTPLMAVAPNPGSISRQSAIAELGLTEWHLSNGVRVVLKPTDHQKDQVLLTGTSPGGTSLLPDSLYVTATLAAAAAAVGGLGELSQSDLRKVLTGKTASASAMIGPRNEAVTGSSSRRDIETLLQLVHLRFTAPRKDEEAFGAYTQSALAALQNRASSPMAHFSDTVMITMGQNHPRQQPMTAETYTRIDLDRALAIYRERFADASDFTFFIVGDFDVDSIRPHVQRYLGSLPSLNRKEEGRDIGVRPPTGVISKVVRAGTEPQSQTFMSFTGPFKYDRQERYLLGSLGEVLQNRLTEKLREALGGTYGVGASAGASREEPAQYSATVSFGSAPDRADELSAAVLAEIRSLQAEGPTAAEVEKVREAQRRARELSLKQNNFWLASLGAAYQYGDDPRSILSEHERFDTLTADALRDVARKYLRLDNYVHITLLPAAPRL